MRLIRITPSVGVLIYSPPPKAKAFPNSDRIVSETTIIVQDVRL